MSDTSLGMPCRQRLQCDAREAEAKGAFLVGRGKGHSLSEEAGKVLLVNRCLLIFFNVHRAKLAKFVGTPCSRGGSEDHDWQVHNTPSTRSRGVYTRQRQRVEAREGDDRGEHRHAKHTSVPHAVV
jgi:hypothetical protein